MGRKVANWLGLIAVAAAVLAAWPHVRPIFGGGASAAARLLDTTGAWGPLVVIGLQMLQAILSPLPSWPVTMAAGALYGPAAGTFYSLVGGTIGATLNFLLARRLGQPLVRRTFGERWVERAAQLKPLHFFVLALFGKLIPIASFDLVAYVAGISQVGLLPFLGVAIAGQAPAILAYAWFGSDLAAANQAGLLSSGLLLLFVLLILGGKRLWERLTA
ncbi:MAG TPA: VTT domain-containing protein [Symbiobacteriaceae bacterium]|nr:VTT domain-containing protein [Symbiobacteriaceae bacterium]